MFCNDIAFFICFDQQSGGLFHTVVCQISNKGMSGFLFKKGGKIRIRHPQKPDALRRWLIDICLSFREKLISVRNRSAQSFIDSAKEYVHNHYTEEELSLDSICKVLGVSNSYFSTLFKKKTGHSNSQN